jgi:hypothetical protein
MPPTNTYNLDIHMYSFEELLNLFNLSYDMDIHDMKRAKKQVLMTHPDKSKLDAKYFLFYKKAFDIIVKFYENQTKQNQTVSNDTKYNPGQQHYDTETSKNINKSINAMDKSKFNNTFNKLFDDNMVNKVDTERNNWFTNEESTYNMDEQITSQNMGQVFDKIKNNQRGLMKYKGVETLHVNSESGNSIYDDDNDSYVTCDPFSKLKFDDLRKVHKDQTVIGVSEKDIQNKQQYSSVDHIMRERGKQQLTPLEKAEAERILSHQNKQYRQQIMQKEYDDKLKTMKYEEKNKGVLATFLKIKN